MAALHVVGLLEQPRKALAPPCAPYETLQEYTLFGQKIPAAFCYAQEFSLRDIGYNQWYINREYGTNHD
jgi:hypothetical protein